MKRFVKLFKSRFAVGLVCALVAVYLFYHLVGMFDGEFSTFAAGITTEHKTLGYDGYIFRDETLLYASDKQGLADYAVEDGTKVTKGQTVATVYSENAEKQQYLRRIDGQIALLESGLNEISDSTDPAEIKAAVSDSYDHLIKMLAAGESGGLSEERDRFLRGLNQMDSLWQGENAPAEKTLAALREARETLLASCGESAEYVADRSGYFYSTVDGYEEAFSMAALERMSGADFFRLTSSAPVATTGAYGKISASSEWRLVLPVAIAEQSYFEVGVTYDGLFEENGNRTLPLTVERILEVPERGVALVIFSCDRLPEHFEFDRCQSVKITVDSASGIYVPQSAVHRVDGRRGVYILRGSVVYFRQIDILYEGSDYYLVHEGRENSAESSYLQVNDLIITKGKNLFDGRVVG